jgi:GNAT superfamily N-acetyltransferase
MDVDVRLRALDPVRDRPLLERLWEAALGPVWPLLPGALDIVRDGFVAEGRPGGNARGGRGWGDEALGVVAVDPAGSIPLLLVDPAARHRGLGTRLLEAGLGRLGELGVGTVGLGSGGDDYIWPGVPDDLPAGVAFFTARGWRFDHSVIDLTADLRGYQAPAGVVERPAQAGVSIEVLAGRDRAEVLSFEAATFPEWLIWFERLGASVLVARDRAGAVVGTLLFSGPPGATIYEPLLGPDAGTIGCVGVAAAAPGSAAPWWPGRRCCCGTRGPAPATSAGPGGSGSTPAWATSPGGATTWPAGRSRAEPLPTPPSQGRREAERREQGGVEGGDLGDQAASTRSTSNLNARNSVSPGARR